MFVKTIDNIIDNILKMLIIVTLPSNIYAKQQYLRERRKKRDTYIREIQFKTQNNISAFRHYLSE